MLPMKTGRKNLIQVGTRQDRNDQASMTERIICRANIDTIPVPSGLERSQSHRRGASHNQSKQLVLERESSTNIEGRAPRTSGIIAPGSNYYNAPSRNAPKPIVPLFNRLSETNAIEHPQSTSEVPLRGPSASRSVSHARTRSEMTQARPDSTDQRHGRSSSKQLSASTKSIVNLPPSKKDQRPTFSTLQQHFTPKKAIKVPSASFFAPPLGEQDREDASLGEMVRLQMELAQLHLLHRDSMTIQAQWENSAERRLQHRFVSLSQQHCELKEIACESQALINQSALVEWCQDLSDVEIARRVQLLSHSIIEIGIMLNSENKIPRVLKSFQAWSDRVSLIHKSRSHSVHGASRNLDFIESIGDAWTADIDAIERKLSSLLREIGSLGEVQVKSSISRVLLLLKSIVSNSTSEIELVRSIEHEVMSQEISWVQDMVQNLATEADNNVDTTAVSSKGVWHTEE